MKRRIYNRCPLCSSPAKVRLTKTVTLTLKEIYLDCTNIETCGHTYVVAQTYQRSISKPLDQHDFNQSDQKTNPPPVPRPVETEPREVRLF